MRTRTIKPGFFKNEALAECHPLARILFEGLWCLADRDGRLEDRPARIKAEVLPYDAVDANELLEQLHQHNFILRYQVNGRKLIQVLKFKEHQRPHPNEATLELPSPSDDAVKLHEDSGKNTARCALTPSLINPSPSSPDEPAGESVPPPSESLGKAKPTARGGTRKPNPLFDAVCAVTASDPKASGSYIGRVCRSLCEADPPYTPDEVRALPAILAARGFTLPLTLGTVEKFIGWTRRQPEPAKAKRDIDEGLRRQREEVAKQKANVSQKTLKELMREAANNGDQP